MKWCLSFIIILWRYIWKKTPTHQHLSWLHQIVPFISTKRLWGNHELLQGASISLEKGLSHNSRSSSIQQLHEKPLKTKMSSPGTRIANFSSQCCPDLPPSFFSITPSQAESERELSLEGIYSSACRASLSVDMISFIFFINRNYRVTPPEKYIDIFEGSTNHIQDQIYDMESSFYCSNESKYE